MHMCIYILTYVPKCGESYIHIYKTQLLGWQCVFLHECMQLSRQLGTCMCLYVYTYVYINIYIYVYIYRHTFLNSAKITYTYVKCNYLRGNVFFIDVYVPFAAILTYRHMSMCPNYMSILKLSRKMHMYIYMCKKTRCHASNCFVHMCM